MRAADIYPELEQYILSKPGVEKDYKVEWDWTRFMIRGKMFAAFCSEGVESALINVKSEPEFNEFMRKTYEDVNAGYYMNKVHWNAVKLTGTVPYDVIKEMCDRGYSLILKSLPKKVQQEILSHKD